MREASMRNRPVSERETFRACLATVLELPFEAVPAPAEDEDVVGWRVLRWLGGLGVGLARVADPDSFSWAGPWIARVRRPDEPQRWAVVMYGVPSGPAWDPAGVTATAGWQFSDGFVVAALDIALARPPLADAPASTGTVQTLAVAPTAGASTQTTDSVLALAGRGLDGDRHVSGQGTFPSATPGSALTLIEAEVCDSFTPPLGPSEHRRNIVTHGVDLNALVGHEFTVGEVRCRGMRLCEPCRVVDGYATRPVLRPLVHRGGLRADILDNGMIHCGDRIQAH